MKTFKYQNKKNSNYFEGWYFRFTDESEINYAVIFAITKCIEDPHCFVQIFNQYDESCKYIKYPVNKFHYDSETDTVHINNNLLSDNILVIDEEIKINLSISNHLYLSENKDKSAMSYLKNFPLECFQEVIFLDSAFTGTIKNGVEKQISGKSYMEKTYGYSFPKKWIWIQSSYGEKSTFTFSTGAVPFKFLTITGFFLILKTSSMSYRFSTTNNSKIKIYNGNSFMIMITRGKYKVIIETKINNSTKLIGPISNGLMNLTVMESLDSECSIKMFNNGVLIFEDKYKNVGVENTFNK